MNIFNLILYLVLTVNSLYALDKFKVPKNDYMPSLIFGENDREDSNSLKFPAKAVGKIKSFDTSFMKTNKECVGTLIAPDYIITSSHCVYNKFGELYKNLYFYKSYHFGKFTIASKITHIKSGWDNLNFNSILELFKNNWTIAKLEKPIGFNSQLGNLTRLYPKVHYIPLNLEVFQIGYGKYFFQGETQSIAKNCYIKRAGLRDPDIYNIILHDCDNSIGDGGAPLITYLDDRKNYYIVGIEASSTIPENYPNPERIHWPDWQYYNNGATNLASEFNTEAIRVFKAAQNGSYKDRLDQEFKSIYFDYPYYEINTYTPIIRNNCNKDLEISFFVLAKNFHPDRFNPKKYDVSKLQIKGFTEKPIPIPTHRSKLRDYSSSYNSPWPDFISQEDLNITFKIENSNKDVYFDFDREIELIPNRNYQQKQKSFKTYLVKQSQKKFGNFNINIDCIE